MYKYDLAECPCGCGSVYEVVRTTIGGKSGAYVRCCIQKRYYEVLDTKNIVPTDSEASIGDFAWLVSQRDLVAGRFMIEYDSDADELTITNVRIPKRYGIKPYTKIKMTTQREAVAKLIRSSHDNPKAWVKQKNIDFTSLFKSGEYKRFRDNEIVAESIGKGMYSGNRRLYTTEEFARRYSELK